VKYKRNGLEVDLSKRTLIKRKGQEGEERRDKASAEGERGKRGKEPFVGSSKKGVRSLGIKNVGRGTRTRPKKVDNSKGGRGKRRIKLEVQFGVRGEEDEKEGNSAEGWVTQKNQVRRGKKTGG